MKNSYLTLFLSLFFLMSNAQRMPEFQDPADWIPLVKSFASPATSVVPRPGQLPEMFSTPIRYVPEKENDLFPLKFKLHYLKFGYSDDREELVQFWGTVDLSCCKNKPVKVELIDKNDNVVHFITTETDGTFKAIGPNGGMLEFDNYRVKVNVHKIKVIDDELNEKSVVLEWIGKPSEKELKRMRKKAARAHKKELQYLKELRNKY